MAKSRGRPRSYDPEVALQAALEVFWERGFAETSLDDLRAATGMNRPSLYAAFGDKKSIYLKAVDRFRQHMKETLGTALGGASDPVQALTDFYTAALKIYLSGPGRGCMSVGTTTAEAALDIDMRADLERTITGLDVGLKRWFEGLKAAQKLDSEADSDFLAFQAVSTLFSLGIRARAGHERALLEKLAAQSASAILHSAR